MELTSIRNDPSLAQADHPFYRDVDRLLVTHGMQTLRQSACERILLPRHSSWPSFHVGGHVARRSDGSLHALVAGGEATMYWRSDDDGVSWTGAEIEVSGVGAFVVLPDDSFLLACVGGEGGSIRILASDDGVAWTPRGLIERDLFDALHIDGNFLVLRDGDLLLAVNMRLWPPDEERPLQGQFPQYLMRSGDGGATWSWGGDRDFWEAVKRGARRVEDDGPEYTWPGEGGTFPGVYETGFLELRCGRLLGAFRFSGPPRPWHEEVLESWGLPPLQGPDAHGRLFRHVVLGESDDGGRTWGGLRPVLAADGTPLMAHGESNGELVQLSTGRLVLVHQTRYAEAFDRKWGHFRGRSTLSARVSDDEGRTWQPERHRVLFGFGYPGSLALPDDTLVTVCGSGLGDDGHPRRAVVVRWRAD